MIGTPRKPPTLKPSTSLGKAGTTAANSTIAKSAPAKAPAKAALGATSSARSSTGIVDRAASAAKSAAIYGAKGSSTTAARAAAPAARPGPSFGNVRGGVASTAPAKKAVFGNVVGGVVSSAATAPRALPSTYTVLQGDSLSKIAKRLYGKSSAWRRLFEANRDQIDDADLIHPGQVLKVPEL